MSIATLQPRMTNPIIAVPGALQAMIALSKAAGRTGLPSRTAKLVHLRASQINGCSYCVEMHARELREVGESFERVVGVAAWRDTPHYDEAERAALALTEAVTRLADRPEAVPTDLWEEATRHYDEPALGGLLIEIAAVNVWNRVNVATQQPAGAGPS